MINWKGGVGKTTLSYHIGVGLWKFVRKKTLARRRSRALRMEVEGLTQRA
jgi:septum formation inhibitor-activating ATPase MinD